MIKNRRLASTLLVQSSFFSSASSSFNKERRQIVPPAALMPTWFCIMRTLRLCVDMGPYKVITSQSAHGSPNKNTTYPASSGSAALEEVRHRKNRLLLCFALCQVLATNISMWEGMESGSCLDPCSLTPTSASSSLRSGASSSSEST